MEFLSSKNIVIILLCIIVVSCLGLGYLEIKNIKSKLTILENTLNETNKGKNNKIPLTNTDTNNKIINNQNNIKKMCIICNRKEASPSSSLKYHNKYCVNCATIDYNNNIKVQKYMESNKQSKQKIKIENNSNSKVDSPKIEQVDKSITDPDIIKGIVDTRIQDTRIQDTRIQDIESEEEEEEVVVEEVDDGEVDDGEEEVVVEVKEEEEVVVEEVVVEEEEEEVEEINTAGFNKQSSEDLNTIKLDILRNLLKENNISYSGNKQIIIGRVIKNNIQTKHLFE
jgi:hypothetical protein